MGLASTSSLAIFTFSPCSLAISSSTGATIRQGPHQAAQKSTRTGVSDLMTSVSKFWSLTTCGLDMVRLLLPPQRQLRTGLFRVRHEIAEYRTAIEMGFRQRASLEVATHVHFEPEATAGVEELDREQRLIGLPAHERVFVA